jgi:glucose/arabinose dehydrogenase
MTKMLNGPFALRLVMAVLASWAMLEGRPSPTLHAQTVPSGFTLSTVVDNLDTDAIAFAQLPDGRFIIANQRSGQLDLAVSGVLAATAVGTVPDVNSAANERGLLAVAVDPEWPDSNYVYTYYTMNDGHSRVIRFPVSGDVDDAGSDSLVLEVAERDTLLEMVDAAGNHNGGSLRFGSDRSLYVSLGDDNNRSLVQDLTTLHGKIVRISPDPGQPLPSPNPIFPSAPAGALDEIFAIGLRNPFRFNLDPKTDRLVIGDVGQSSFEEIDLSEGGENFGWPRWEAESLFDTVQTLIPPDPTFPIYSYAHRPSGPVSVVALATYRQSNYPNDASFPEEFDGAHFLSDFYLDTLWVLQRDAYGGWVADTFGTGYSAACDAALARDGGMFVLEYGNALKKITYDPGPIVELEGSIFLEGPYAGSATMDTTLRTIGALPTSNPFSDSTFDGTFLEYDLPVAIDSVPPGVVDWVLVELRSTTSAASREARSIGFVRRDGVLLGAGGDAGILIPGVDSTDYYVVVGNRNHAAVMSASPVAFGSGLGTWDFSTSQSQAYMGGSDPMIELETGVYGLFAGDADIDGQFTVTDFNVWLSETKAVATGYIQSDFDHDGQSTVTDFNVWLVNAKAVRASQVPGY